MRGASRRTRGFGRRRDFVGNDAIENHDGFFARHEGANGSALEGVFFDETLATQRLEMLDDAVCRTDLERIGDFAHRRWIVVLLNVIVDVEINACLTFC